VACLKSHPAHLPFSVPKNIGHGVIGRGSRSGQTRRYQLVNRHDPRVTIHIRVHVFDDDLIFNAFYLYRPVLVDEDEEDDIRIRGEGKSWRKLVIQTRARCVEERAWRKLERSGGYYVRLLKGRICRKSPLMIYLKGHESVSFKMMNDPA
jgi:hypothetical protein